jgi:hypothetical protein
MVVLCKREAPSSKRKENKKTNINLGQAKWPQPVILAVQEVEISRIGG